MNQLSWLVYLADVCGSIGVLITILVVIFSIFLICWVIAYFIGLSNFEEKEWKTWRRCGWFLAPSCLIIFFLGCFIPGKETVYAIAASQVGEQVLKTPLAQKAGQAIEVWLDKQIATNTKKDSN